MSLGDANFIGIRSLDNTYIYYEFGVFYMSCRYLVISQERSLGDSIVT